MSSSRRNIPDPIRRHPLLILTILASLSLEAPARARSGAVGACQSAMLVYITLTFDVSGAASAYRRCKKQQGNACAYELRKVEKIRRNLNTVGTYLDRYCGR